MSFPNIPDIDPQINISFEDAINLLLTSIAMEEISLSKLIDAETKKLLCAVEDLECCDSKNAKPLLRDTLKINKSIDDMIKNISKLQMLLQYKLDNIKEILPCTNTSSTTSTSTSTTTTCTKTTSTKTTSSSTSSSTTCTKTTSTKTTSSTTTCTTSTCSTTTKRVCCCGLIGKGKGRVPNRCDAFYGHTAVLNAFIYCGSANGSSLSYSVGNKATRLSMRAASASISIKCPEPGTGILVIHGKGHAEKHVKHQQSTSGRVDFVLTVGRTEACDITFRVETKSKECPELNHDSGVITHKGIKSDINLVICC